MKPIFPLRNRGLALSASGDVRNDGRPGSQTCKGCFADCLLFACGCVFQGGNQADPGCHRPRAGSCCSTWNRRCESRRKLCGQSLSGEKGHKMGYSNIMYLDAAEHKYLEECGACNFFGIKDGKYITPKSPSVLPSITNMSLRQLARDMGLEVEDRKIPVEELTSFEECGGCGTAAVISLSALSMTCKRRKPTLMVIRLVRFLWNYIPDCRIFSTDELRINIIGVRLFCRIRIYC